MLVSAWRAGFLIAGLLANAQAFAQGSAPPPPVQLSAAQREAAEKRAVEKQKLQECNKQASEQKVMVRDLTKFLIECMER